MKKLRNCYKTINNQHSEYGSRQAKFLLLATLDLIDSCLVIVIMTYEDRHKTLTEICYFNEFLNTPYASTR